MIATKYPHELSGGQRQRVAIARALAVEPRAPGRRADLHARRLDPDGGAQPDAAAKEERGISFLYITHDLASARYVADDIMVMYAGQIVERAPIVEVLARPLHPYTQLLISAVPNPAAPREKPSSLRGGRSLSHPSDRRLPLPARCPIAIDVCSRVTPDLVDRAGAGGAHPVKLRATTCGKISAMWK